MAKAKSKKPAVKRFFYVYPRRSNSGNRVKHIKLGKSHSEGRTVCGRNVTPDWNWMDAKHSQRFRTKTCSECIRVNGPGIYVERTAHRK